MPEETEIRKTGKGFLGHAFTWVAFGFCVVAIYVLSVGPVEKIVGQGNNKVLPALRAFYAPLIWANDNNRFARKFFKWYTHEVWHSEH